MFYESGCFIGCSAAVPLHIKKRAGKAHLGPQTHFPLPTAPSWLPNGLIWVKAGKNPQLGTGTAP